MVYGYIRVSSDKQTVKNRNLIDRTSDYVFVTNNLSAYDILSILLEDFAISRKSHIRPTTSSSRRWKKC